VQHEDLGPNPFGVPYFEADVRNHQSVGICPRCGAVVVNRPGAFYRHWEEARADEADLLAEREYARELLHGEY
jgi:hypothetical protein